MSKNLIDYYSDAGDGAPSTITELRLGAEPAMTLLFTPECQEVLLHYVADESVRSYVQCPGEGCPICYTGSSPSRFDLLPLFDVESGIVKVLRIPDNRRPTGLAAKLVPHLKDKDVADKLILISRQGTTDYSVEARPLGPDANRGEVEINAFVERVDEGLQLRGAFPEMTPAELAEVPKVAARLEALGGWVPPGESKSGGGATGAASDDS